MYRGDPALKRKRRVSEGEDDRKCEMGNSLECPSIDVDFLGVDGGFAGLLGVHPRCPAHSGVLRTLGCLSCDNTPFIYSVYRECVGPQQTRDER